MRFVSQQLCRRLISIIFLFLPLMACKVQVTSHVSSSDIVEAIRNRETTIPVQLVIYASLNENQASEAARQIERTFAQHNIQVVYKGFTEIRGSMENRILFESDVPIRVANADQYSDPKNVMSILLVPSQNQDNTKYNVFLQTNTDLISRIRNGLRRQNSFWNVSDRNITFIVELKNDLQQSINVGILEAFVNDRPVLKQDITLSRRHGVTITLSDVLSSSLVSQNMGLGRVATISIPIGR